MGRLGIVIPTVDRPASLGATLARLERQAAAVRDFEVVVVSPAAGDQGVVKSVIGERPYKVRQLLGPSADASSQRNIGWRALSTPLILFIGDDILASGSLVAAHLAAHRRWPAPEVGVLGCVRWPRRPRPTAFMRWLENGIQFDFRGLEPGADAGWWRFYTANASLKREMLERVDGFDEVRFPFLYEDLDLAARMAEHQFTLRYEPAASAEHAHHQTLGQWRTRLRQIAVAERRFCERHPNAKPYFYEMFADAMAHPPARGRGARLAEVIPATVPWLGPRVWASFDMWNRQQMAPEFLAAWSRTEESADGQRIR